LLLLCETALAQVLHDTQELLASDGAQGDWFGFSVSISGDVAVVGAIQTSQGPGAAYIFRSNGLSWVQEQKLLASDREEGDFFGASVSISGDVTLVGAPGDDDYGTNSGSAYIFRWDGSSWAQEQKLVTSSRFGAPVSISNDVAVVVSGHDNGSGVSGSVYVFRWNGSSWMFEQGLWALDGATDDYFGQSVSVFGDVVVVGASGDDDNGAESGSTYVFRRNGSSWVQEQKLLASDGAEDDMFGNSVTTSGDVVMVGAPLDDDHGASSGSAYVFHWNGSSWVENQKLLPSDGAQGDAFGQSISISGDNAVVGAYFDDDNGSLSGSAYVFHLDGSSWVQKHKLLPSDGADQDVFGYSVSASGSVALVGAFQNAALGGSSGAAYVFNLSCDPGHYGPMCLECPGGASNPCTGHGTCDDGVDGSGACTCNTGWTGPDCASDVDECATDQNNCDANATCTNAPGSFACTCKPGYEGDGVTCISGSIPTVSAWGLTILTMLLLAGAKIRTARSKRF